MHCPLVSCDRKAEGLSAGSIRMQNWFIKEDEGEKMLKFFKNRFFKTTFIIYILLLGIFTSAFYFVFFYQQKHIREERIQRESLSQAKIMLQIIDEKFSSIGQMTTQISASSWRPYVASRSDILYSNVDYFMKEEICQQIETFQSLLSIAKSLAVLFPQKDLVVDSDSFWEMERYFRFLDLGDEWMETMEEVLSVNSRSMNLLGVKNNEKGDFIILKQLTKESVSQGMLFVLVDHKYFEKYVNTNLPEAAGFTISLDGEVIYSLQEFDFQDSVVEVRLPSNLYSWEYCFSVRVNSSENSFWNIYYIMTGYLGCILIMIVVSYSLARLTYLPIVRILKKIDWIKETEYYGLERFEQVYRELQTEKDYFEELGNQYYQIGKNSFVHSLLMGTYDKEYISEYAKKFHMDISSNMLYQVMIFYVLDRNNQDTFLDKILKFQIDCYKNKITAITCNVEDKNVLILGTAAGERTLFKQRETLNMFVDEHLSEIDLELYTGTVNGGFRGINLSYKEAQSKTLEGKKQDVLSEIENRKQAHKSTNSILGENIVKYVDENYMHSGLSQQDIAERFGVSRPTVSKTFKETKNMNFVDYLHKKRVEHAKELITKGNYDVLKVAKESGFENEVTFKRAFVKNEGITPRAYIKQKKLMI